MSKTLHMLKKFIIFFILTIILIPKISYSSSSRTNIQESYLPLVKFFEKHLSEEELSNFNNLLVEFDGFHEKDYLNCKGYEECGEAALKTFTEINDFIKTKSEYIFNNNAFSDESINSIKEITEKNDVTLKRYYKVGFSFYYHYLVVLSDENDSSVYNLNINDDIGNMKTIDSNDDETSQTNSDTSDQLSDALKSSLANVIDENLTKDLQIKIAKYVNAISKKLTDDEKTKLLGSTTKMLSISSKRDKNDLYQLYDLLGNLEIIIDIINPYILDEMGNQKIPNNLQINAWLAFSDLKEAININNLDLPQIEKSFKVISKALVADSITEDNKVVTEKETETETEAEAKGKAEIGILAPAEGKGKAEIGILAPAEAETEQSNESIKVVYKTDENKDEIGKVQKAGRKGFLQDGTSVKKRNKILTNTLLKCISSSTGCQITLGKKTAFYLESGTEIIINSFFVDADGTQFIKACLLDGGFYFKTLRKTNSQVAINIKNNDTNSYDAIFSKGLDAKLGVSKEDNVLDVVNAGGAKVSLFRIYSENADEKKGDINTSNIEDFANMFKAPVNDFLPSITNANGDPCIKPNFGDISVLVQETNTNTCSHNHAHVDGEDGEPMLGSKNEERHKDEYNEGIYDLGINCNPDIEIPYIICPDDFSCTLTGVDPKKSNPSDGPAVEAGEDHHG